MSADDQYLAGDHPGTDIWRHARTPLTPAYPRWAGEGITCPVEGCDGLLTTYKLDAHDPGVDSMPEWRSTTSAPDGDSYAGDWICSGCLQVGRIALREVQQHRDDIPRRDVEDNIIPLFGPREYDRG